jgi:hypothetical protein
LRSKDVGVSRKTDPVPLADVLRAVAIYQNDARIANSGLLTPRQAERAFRRLAAACREVLRALASLPEELQTLYSGPLYREAAQIGSEVESRLEGWRLYGFPNRRRWLSAPRVRLEARIAELYLKHGGRLSTYDPRRYVEPRGKQGKRGGRLAQVLLTTYELAKIAQPADLTPILRRLRASPIRPKR